MKIIKFIPLGIVLFLTSCVKNEMKISRADQTIVSELIEQSPIYITKKDDGSMKVNENNRIGNTDWVFSIESNLPLGSVLPEVQRLIEKKYADGLHSDSKNVYFIYLDTVANKPAYLPVHQLKFISDKPQNPNDLKFEKEETVEKFIQEMVKTTTLDTLIQTTPVYFY